MKDKNHTNALFVIALALKIKVQCMKEISHISALFVIIVYPKRILTTDMWSQIMMGRSHTRDL